MEIPCFLAIAELIVFRDVCDGAVYLRTSAGSPGFTLDFLILRYGASALSAGGLDTLPDEGQIEPEAIVSSNLCNGEKSLLIESAGLGNTLAPYELASNEGPRDTETGGRGSLNTAAEVDRGVPKLD